MAAKKPTKPKKFRQARSAAKADAKKTFSGNPQARLKDPKLKLSADDKMALKEMRDSAKADLGNKSTLTKKEFLKADNAAREAFRSEMRAEFGEYGGKKATPLDSPRNTRVMKESAPRKITKNINPLNKTRTFVEASPIKSQTEKPKTSKSAVDTAETKPAKTKKAAAPKKPAVKKAAVKKPAVKKPATVSTTVDKTLKTPEGKARYDKLIKEGVKPKSALNKALFYEAKLPSQKAAATPKAESKPKVKKAGATKAGSFKNITDASLTSQEDAYRQSKVDKLVKEGKLSGSKEIAIRSKGEVVKPGAKVPATTTQVARPIPGSDTVVKKKGGKLGKFAKGGAYLAAFTAAMDLPNYTDAAKRKAQAEVDLYAAKNKGKNPGFIDRTKIAAKGMPMVRDQVLKYFTGGVVGKDASAYAAKAEKELAKYKESERKTANKNLRYGPNGESLVPGTDAWKKGSKTRPKFAAPGAAGGTTPGTKPGATPGASGGSSGGSKGGSSKGGSTPSVTPGSTYTVKSGDTLSAIAKASGVKLADIYAANKKFKQNPKYKGGNMIWSGTTVKIPTIKK